jgi:hypothetical protein
MENDDPKDKEVDIVPTTEPQIEKLKFGSLTPLTSAQVVTLLVGASINPNTSYGGY